MNHNINRDDPDYQVGFRAGNLIKPIYPNVNICPALRAFVARKYQIENIRLFLRSGHSHDEIVKNHLDTIITRTHGCAENLRT